MARRPDAEAAGRLEQAPTHRPGPQRASRSSRVINGAMPRP